MNNSEGKMYKCTFCWRTFYVYNMFKNVKTVDFEKRILCLKCFKREVEEKTRAFRTLSNEYDYFVLLSNNGEFPEDNEEENRKMEKEIEELKKTEKSLLCEIESLNYEVEQTKFHEEWEARIEENYWKHYHTFFERGLKQYDEKRSIISFLRELSTDVIALNSFNTFNECFHVWYDNDLKSLTINSFRVGGEEMSASQWEESKNSRKKVVTWEEINLGLGEICMLLTVVCRAVGYTFVDYQIIPRGCRSYVKDVTSSAFYELFYRLSNSNREFWLGKFNKGLLILLKSIQELAAFLRTSLPKQVKGNSIGEMSVEYDPQQSRKWSIAMKYLLIDVKHLIKAAGVGKNGNGIQELYSNVKGPKKKLFLQ